MAFEVDSCHAAGVNMAHQWDGFYAAYMTGAGGQGFGLFVFQNGRIVGSDPLGRVDKVAHPQSD
jgi:hypothetical protein